MNARTITTRQEAVALGLPRYFTGEPCHAGHYSERNRHHHCIECNRMRARQNREGKSPETEYGRAYYQANKEARLARAAKWREDNLERDKRRRAEYRTGRKDQVCLYSRSRRARLAAAAGSHTVEDIDTIAKAQRRRCAYCKVKLRKPQVDHIEPLALGGSNDRRNLQITCKSCNSRKHSKDPIEFARSLGRLL
jgi:5-methylcytosine-specific restriction endonuclease McrA